jgi:hypothetical protein
LHPPRAFISHAGEDKERFVLEFATRLRVGGVDAWLDRWEIAAGDSLVKRIYDEGIGQASAIIVVLSRISVQKPWVRDELDAATVRRVEDQIRLIPVVIDNVTVPSPLRHLLWLDLARVGMDGVVDGVVRALFGGSEKPAVGPPPRFTVATVPSYSQVAEAVDRLILFETIEWLRQYPFNTILMSNDLQELCRQKHGISAQAFHESMLALTQTGLIVADQMLGGERWWIKSIPPHTWLEHERLAGSDVADQRRRLLASLVNEEERDSRPLAEHLGIDHRTLVAILQVLERAGLVRHSLTANGYAIITSVSPLAQREVRSSGLSKQTGRGP